MDKENVIEVTLDNGDKLKLEEIIRVYNEETDKKYIVCSNWDKEDDRMKLYICSYEENGEELILHKIENKDELDFVTGKIKEALKDS